MKKVAINNKVFMELVSRRIKRLINNKLTIYIGLNIGHFVKIHF